MNANGSGGGGEGTAAVTQAMNEAFARLVQAFDQSPVLVALYDQFDRLRYANDAFRAAFFIAPNEEPTWPEIMRRNHRAGRGTVIQAQDFEGWLNSTQSRRGKIGFRAYETDLADGRWLWMKESVFKDGWMLCIASDVTALHVETRSLRQDRDSALKASYTDELTGVANRRFVMARIEDMLRWSRTDSAQPGCLAVLDIDNFKLINDRYGHQAGDEILRSVATRINAHIRRSDCFGRIGGEEFLLVMPRSSIAEAELILERMLALTRTFAPLAGHPDFFCTFSAGLTAVMPDDVALSLYARADRALYVAKAQGRNRILRSDLGEESLAG